MSLSAEVSTARRHLHPMRPGRSARQAIRKARDLYNEGYRYVVDLDLSKYFDTINHELLLNMVREEVRDKAVIRLIKQFLKSGVMVNGVLVSTESGSPQGGPLSPLLSNIYLTKFDKEMEKRGHKFVRYADDVNVYVRSRRSAQRVLASCKQYLEACYIVFSWLNLLRLASRLFARRTPYAPSFLIQYHVWGDSATLISKITPAIFYHSNSKKTKKRPRNH